MLAAAEKPAPMLTSNRLRILLALALAGIVFSAAAKEEGQKQTRITVHGAQVEEGGDPDNPEIPASLKKYASVLKALKNGKYSDAGGEGATVAVGASHDYTVGKYTVSVTLSSADKGEAVANYTIKEGDKQVAADSVKLKAGGSPAVAQVGDAKRPLILFFDRSK